MSKLNLFDGLQEVAAGAPDENGIPKFDEQKLRRYLKNTKLGAPNKERYMQIEPKFYTCPRYNPCPICHKCTNRAIHLYMSCRNCKIVKCHHTHSDKVKMIKRENFETVVDKDIYNVIKQLDKEITGEN
jgi:hypothetical protein